MKMLKKISISLFLILIFIFVNVDSVSAVPYVATNYFCLVDSDTGQVIYSKAQDEKRPVASTTKMMTAILAVE